MGDELKALDRLSSGLDSERLSKSRFISLPVSLALETSEATVNTDRKSGEYVSDSCGDITSKVESTMGVGIISIHGKSTDYEKTVQGSPKSNGKIPLIDNGIHSKNNDSEKGDTRLTGGDDSISNHDIASPAIKSHLNISDFADTKLESILSRDSSINISKIMGSEKSLLSSFISEGGTLEEERKEGDIGENFSSSTIVKMDAHLVHCPLVTGDHDIVGDITNSDVIDCTPAKNNSGIIHSIHSEQDGEQYSLNVGDLDYNCDFPSSSNSNSAQTNDNSAIVEGKECNSGQDSGILDLIRNNKEMDNEIKETLIDSYPEKCLLEKIRILKKEEGTLYFKLIKASAHN